MNNETNKMTIAGTIVTEPQEYENCDESFYAFDVSAKRLSGVEDLVPVNVPKNLIDNPKLGDKVCFSGQIRTYNKVVNKKSRLIIAFFALASDDYKADINECELHGFICKEPVYRETPFGRKICDMLVAVNRGLDKSDYIPCVVWGRNAIFAGKLTVSSPVTLQGRLQSRLYEKLTENGVETRTAYEVSVAVIEKAQGDAQ